MEVGGHPACQEEEAKELLAEVKHIPMFLSLFPSSSLTHLLPISLTAVVDNSDCYLLFPPLQGLRLLQGVSEKREEARKIEAEAENMETEGWGKLREAVMGSEAEGLYGLLRGVTSHSCHILPQPPPSRPCPCPKSPVPQKLPQESTGPKVSDPVGPTSTSAPVATISVPEGDLLADMQPLRIQLGGTKRIYKCWVEGCEEGPSTSWAAICAHVRKVHLGVGLVCPLCGKSFYNLDVFRCHKKTH